MDNYENNNNSEEYTNPNLSEEEISNQPRKYDPAGDAKKKILFFIVVVVIMLAIKYGLGL